MRITAVGMTDVGLQRDHNEDSFGVLPEFKLYVVADGMGGHQAGDVASRMAIDGIRAFYEATQKEDATWPFPIDPNLSLTENRLSAATKLANRQIYDRSCSDESMHGMGTTVVGIVFSETGDTVYVAHVGDSRAYRIRDGKIVGLTRDHSLVNDYLMMMPDLAQDAMDVVPRNVITRALGMQDSVVVDLGAEKVKPGDRFVVCSDGLHGQVSDARILEAVDNAGDDLDAAGRQLIKLANDAGGDDNVTVIIAHALADDVAAKP